MYITKSLCAGAIIVVKDDELNIRLIEKDDKSLMHLSKLLHESK